LRYDYEKEATNNGMLSRGNNCHFGISARARYKK